MRDAGVPGIKGRTKRTYAWTVAASICAIALFLTLAGTSAGRIETTSVASPGHPMEIYLMPAKSTKYLPPYVGRETTLLEGQESGCAGTRAPVYPTLNMTTGTQLASITTNTSSCPSTLGNSTQLEGFGLIGSAFTTHAGLHHVAVHVTTSFVASVGVQPAGEIPGVPLASSSVANFSVVWTAVLFDVTKNTDVEGTSVPALLAHETNDGNSTYHYKALALTAYFNATLTATDSYQIVVTGDIEVSISVVSNFTGASASVKMATGTMGTEITSIVFT